MSRELVKKIKFTPAPKSCTDGKSIILISTEYMSVEELFETLTSMFYNIKETVNKYQKD